MKEASDVHCVG